MILTWGVSQNQGGSFGGHHVRIRVFWGLDWAMYFGIGNILVKVGDHLGGEPFGEPPKFCNQSARNPTNDPHSFTEALLRENPDAEQLTRGIAWSSDVQRVQAFSNERPIFRGKSASFNQTGSHSPLQYYYR